VHLDGAFGLRAATSPRHRALLRGVDQADSWATDGHKWLNVSYDCGYAFVAHSVALRASMSLSASYVPAEAGHARDQMDRTPEWSRRARGFATCAAIRQPWTATSFVFTSAVDPSESVDVIEVGGSVSITLDEETDPSTCTVEPSGNTLTIRVTNGPEFDFDDDGTDEPATVLMVLTRA
jgi:hypothetical protein